MTTKEILNLDCRIKENKETIQKVLRKIKPLSKCSDEYDIPIEAIEKAITVMCKKYTLYISNLSSDTQSNEKNLIWSTSVRNDKTFECIAFIYGITLYELLAKIAIAMYAEIKKGISKRN